MHLHPYLQVAAVTMTGFPPLASELWWTLISSGISADVAMTVCEMLMRWATAAQLEQHLNLPVPDAPVDATP